MSDVRLTIDHVIECVPDLEEAASRYMMDHGLTAVPGGRHTGHGTANWIVPLGSAYIELLAVVDREEGAESALSAWVDSRAEGPGLDCLVVRTDDIEELARRNELDPVAMTRLRPDGLELGWRLAGLERALNEGLPFFIQWDVAEEILPGATVTEPANPRTGIDRVVISGDVSVLGPWIEGCEGVEIVEGEPGVVSASIAGYSVA